MALLTRISVICNICKANRSFSKLCTNSYYLVKRQSSQMLKSSWQSSLEARRISIYSLFSRPSAEKLKQQDNIPDEYQLIYRNIMSRYLLAAQFFNAFCVCMLCFTAIVANVYNPDPGSGIPTWGDVTQQMDNEFFLLVTAFLGVCCVVQLYISRMPIRIYYLRQQKNYIMILYRSFPFATKRVTCKVNQVTKLPAGGILPWNDSMYKTVNSQKLILLDNYFRKPSDYNIMMGYQKDEGDDENTS